MQCEYGLVQLQAPETEPVTPTAVKQHIRVTSSLDDDLISSWITASREYFETITGLQLMPARWRLMLPTFPYFGNQPSAWFWTAEQVLELPKPPLRSVDQILYADPDDGVMLTLDPAMYQWSSSQIVGRVAPTRYQVWPLVDVQTLDAVRIDFSAGYASMAAVPERAKQGIRLLVAHCYENRQIAVERVMASVPLSLNSWLRSMKTGSY